MAIELDNSVSTNMIRKTTWGVDMREPIAKSIENEDTAHQQRTVEYQMDPVQGKATYYILTFIRRTDQ